MSNLAQTDRHSHNPLVRYFRILGPGLVTGAADDDPSGITTYSVAGASLGYFLSAVLNGLLAPPLLLLIMLVGNNRAIMGETPMVPGSTCSGGWRRRSCSSPPLPSS